MVICSVMVSKPQLNPARALTRGLSTASGRKQRKLWHNQVTSSLENRKGASNKVGLTPYHAKGVATFWYTAMGSVSKDWPPLELSVDRTSCVQPNTAPYPIASYSTTAVHTGQPRARSIGSPHNKYSQPPATR